MNKYPPEYEVNVSKYNSAGSWYFLENNLLNRTTQVSSVKDAKVNILNFQNSKMFNQVYYTCVS